MRRKKLLAGVLTTVLLVGSISPVGVMGAEVSGEVQTDQVVIEETERQEDEEEAVTAEEEVKSAEADENGFVIENGVLTDYVGEGGDVTIPDGVTHISVFAFFVCESLTSITIPDSVTSIGSAAFTFNSCSNLTAINVSEGNKNYTSENGILYNVSKSTLIQCPQGKTGEVIISNNVTDIESLAFSDCKGLESIIIPAGVTSIGNNAFSGCSSLKGIILPTSIKSIDDRTFSGCSGLESITIPDGVRSIGDYVFENCYSLTAIDVSEGNKNYTSENGMLYNMSKSTLIKCPQRKTGKVIIPDNVTSIGDYAFQDCSSLTSITIPDSVMTIGRDAFFGCENLTSITIPVGVTSIEYETFGECSNLSSITIPDNVMSIGGNAFYLCSSLESITIPDSVTNIGDYAFSGCDITSITISNSVTSIGEGTFSDCNSLTSIIIPNSVTSIGDYAFNGCDNITSITISGGVTSIGDYAFYDCDSLTSIIIPVGVTSIGYVAFGACGSLTSITIPDSVTSIGNGAFEYCNEDLIIYCEKNSYAETYAKENDINYSYVVEKDIQTITASDNITKTFDDSAFSIGAVTDGDGILSYVSDNEAVVKVDSEGTITLVGAGTAHITITASETNTYKAAEKVITITVEKKAQTITASDITKTLGEAAFPLNAAVDGDGTLTYVSDNPSVVAIAENGTVTLVSAGTAHITIKASETANYKAAEKVITVTVKPAETSSEEPSETPTEESETKEQTITAKNITKTYGDKAFSLGAKTNGGGKLTYQVLNTKIATINKKGNVTIKGCGRTQIKITAAANGDYQAATKTITLTVKPKKLNLTSVKSTKSKAVTVKWKQDKKAKGYIIECSTDKKFKKNVKTVTISKNSTVSKTVTKLKGGKTYYVRACAYTTADGKKIKGSYSKVMTAKVKK